MHKSAKKILCNTLTFLKNRYYLLSINAEYRKLIQDIRSKNLTYLSIQKLANIVTVCNHLKKTKLTGVFIEAGCALGGSSILISKLKPSTSALYVYDVFETIPPPTIEDTEDVRERYQTIIDGKSVGIGNDKYYGYEKNLYEIVKQNLKEFQINTKKDNVHLIQGLIQDTLEINVPVAFAHIDVDWYLPVKVCLERIFPRLVIGGSLIIDDYYDWGSSQKATDEYLKKIKGQYKLNNSAGVLTITKIK